MNTRTLAIATLAGALSLSTVAIGVSAASAATSPANLNGSCSHTSVGNMQIQREDTGRLSIGVDMAPHHAGVLWKVTVTNNGHVVVRMTTPTQIDGSFSITRHVAPVVGTSHLVFRARNLTTGETCVLHSTF